MISVIILNHNGLHLLKEFLPSILTQDYPKEVIVVDNGSTDGSQEFLKTQPVKVIRLYKNHGIPKAYNLGTRYAKGDYVLWTANDIRFGKDVLKYLSKHKGICTTKMYRDGRIDNIGAGIDFLGFPTVLKKGRPFASCGGSLYVKKSLALKLRLDNDYFILNDDIDFSWRCRLLGYEVEIEPKAIMHHLGDVTIDKIFDRADKRYFSERNMLTTLLKNYSLGYLTFILPIYFLLLFGEIIFFSLWRKWSIVKSLFQAVGWNIKNLKKTLIKRKKIQRLRTVPDKEIFKLMTKTPKKVKMFLDFIFHYNEWRNYASSRNRRSGIYR